MFCFHILVLIMNLVSKMAIKLKFWIPDRVGDDEKTDCESSGDIYGPALTSSSEIGKEPLERVK